MKDSIQHVNLMTCLMTMATVIAIATSALGAEEWLVAESSSTDSRINVTVSGSAVTVQFSQQGSPPSTLRTDIMVGGANPASVFTGNLSEAGYSGIRLRITGTGEQPAEASVLIRTIVSEDPLVTRDWRYSGVTVSPNPGEWTISDIPLQRALGWRTAGDYKRSDDALDAMWTEDMQNVEMMFVRLQSGGFAEQAYSVSDFRLMGTGVISAAANLSPLQHYFGIDSFEGLDEKEIAALMAQDSDGNGMSDYHEILAGFDPFDPESVFEARIAAASGRNMISWNAVLGRRYAVWRSTDLGSGFLPLFEGIQATATGVMSIEDEDPVPGKPNFYKVVTY